MILFSSPNIFVQYILRRFFALMINRKWEFKNIHSFNTKTYEGADTCPVGPSCKAQDFACHYPRNRISNMISTNMKLFFNWWHILQTSKIFVKSRNHIVHKLISVFVWGFALYSTFFLFVFGHEWIVQNLDQD